MTGHPYWLLTDKERQRFADDINEGSGELDRRLDRRTDMVEGHLTALNHAIELTRDHGPAAGIEYIADYLNSCDGVDLDILETLDDDWLTQWTPSVITKAAILAAGLAGLGLGIRFVSLCIGRGWFDRT